MNDDKSDLLDYLIDRCTENEVHLPFGTRCHGQLRLYDLKSTGVSCEFTPPLRLVRDGSLSAVTSS